MRILELTCGHCGAVYDVAESATIDGDASEFTCSVCGAALARFEERRYRVCRLVAGVERLCFHVPPDAPEPLIPL